MNAMFNDIVSMLSPMGFTVKDECYRERQQLRVLTPFYPVILFGDPFLEGGMTFKAVVPFMSKTIHEYYRCRHAIERCYDGLGDEDFQYEMTPRNVEIQLVPPPLEVEADGTLDTLGKMCFLKTFLFFLNQVSLFLFSLAEPESRTLVTGEEWLVGVNGFMRICADWETWAERMIHKIVASRPLHSENNAFSKLRQGDVMIVESNNLSVYIKGCSEGLSLRMRLHWDSEILPIYHIDSTANLGSSSVEELVGCDCTRFFDHVVQQLISIMCFELHWYDGRITV